MAAKDDQFEASASALGYLYQFAKALQLCIEQWVGGLEWSVAVEAADDIEKHADPLTDSCCVFAGTPPALSSSTSWPAMSPPSTAAAVARCI